VGGLGARHDLLSTNLFPVEHSAPGPSQREPEDSGAAVYLELDGHSRVLGGDQWARAADNIGAIAAHIAAMRAIDRYGVGSRDQAFAGYAALPARAPSEWWSVLEVESTATLKEAEASYKRLERNNHRTWAARTIAWPA
jgi:hypothetical protein